jgi:hypothetical protein
VTIEQLENYRANCVELEKVREEIGESEVTIAVQSAATFPYSLHTVTEPGIPSTASTTYLREREWILASAIAEVRAFMRSLPESPMKSMINVRYIHGKRAPSWLEIAFEFGYHDESTPRQKVRQFIQNQE